MRSAAAAVIVAAAALAGCGGGESTSTPVATDRIELAKSYRFEPEAIRVERGTEVTWHNDDNFTHTVQIGDGDARKLAPGESFSQRFTRPGTFRYVCTLHPGMNGEVVVE